MRYSYRIASVSFVVAAITLALVVSVPHSGDVRVIHTTSADPTVSQTAPIIMPFSRPVDRRSAEQAFVLYPPAKGRLTWQGHSMIFQPLAPLQAHTIYRVTLKAGLHDIWGRANEAPMQWVIFTE
jgi:hypothetical protein